jgi:predicted Holliday junction resolvase-like endonuclease
MIDVNGVTIALIVFALGLFIVLVKTVYRFKKEVLARASEVEEKVAKIERKAVALKATLSEIQDEVSEKIDLDYLNKRIDGLINLINEKKTES